MENRKSDIFLFIFTCPGKNSFFPCPHMYISIYIYRYDDVLVTCFITVTKISEKKQITQEGFIKAHSLKVWYIMVRNS